MKPWRVEWTAKWLYIYVCILYPGKKLPGSYRLAPSIHIYIRVAKSTPRTYRPISGLRGKFPVYIYIKFSVPPLKEAVVCRRVTQVLSRLNQWCQTPSHRGTKRIPATNIEIPNTTAEFNTVPIPRCERPSLPDKLLDLSLVAFAVSSGAFSVSRVRPINRRAGYDGQMIFTHGSDIILHNGVTDIYYCNT